MICPNNCTSGPFKRILRETDVELNISAVNVTFLFVVSQVVLAAASNYLRQILLDNEEASVVILPGVSGELLKLITR